MAVRFDGDLSQRSTWTKRWRLRYFAVSDASLACWDSEAAATAPITGTSSSDAEVNPPVSSLRLSDRLAVIIVHENDELYMSDANAADGPGLPDWEDASFSRAARGEALSVATTVAPLSSSASARRLLRQRTRGALSIAGSSSPDVLQAARSDESADAAAHAGGLVSPALSSTSGAPSGPSCGLSTASLRYAASLVRDSYGSPAFTAGDAGAAAAGTLEVGSPGLSSSGRSSAPSPSPSILTPSPPRPTAGASSTASAATAEGDGSSGGTTATAADAADALALPHVLVLAHLPRSSASTGASAASAAGAGASPASASASPSSSGLVTGAGAGLREALVLAAPNRAELQLWAFVLRALCAPGGPRPLPPHIASIIASRNEVKQAGRKLAGLLAMPSLPIVLSLPTPTGFTPVSSPLPAPPPFPASPARGAAASTGKPSAFSSGSGLVRRPNAVMAATAPVASAAATPAPAEVAPDTTSAAAATAAEGAAAAAQSPPAEKPQLRLEPEPPAAAVESRAGADASAATKQQRWECGPDGPDRVAMRESVLTLLMARAPTASATAGRLVRAASNVGDHGALAEAADAALASIASGSAASGPASGVSGDVPANHLAHLKAVLVPKLEDGLYEAAAGDRPAYTDRTTLKARLRAVMAGMRAVGGGGAPPLPPAAAATAVAAAAAPTLAAAAALVANAETASLSSARGAAAMPSEPPADASTASEAALAPPSAPSPAAAPPAKVESAAAASRVEPVPEPKPTIVSAVVPAAPVQLQPELVQRYGAVGPRGKPHPWTDPSSPYYMAGHTIRHYPPPDSFDEDLPGAASAAGSLQGRRAMPGSLHLCLVLDRRPPHPPHLPTLNKWQHRRCAGCGVTQTTGMFGTKAHYCHYTELLFCGACMTPPPQASSAFSSSSAAGFDSSRGSVTARAPRSSLFVGTGTPIAGPGAPSNGVRPIPWRVVHQLDDAPLPVCRAAAGFIDRLWTAPLVALSAVAPATLARVPILQRIVQLRARLADAIEAVVTAAEAGDAGSGPADATAGGQPSRSGFGIGRSGGAAAGGSAAGGWSGGASTAGDEEGDGDDDDASLDFDGGASASSSMLGRGAAARGDGGEDDDGAGRLVVLPPAPPASVAGSATGSTRPSRRPHPGAAPTGPSSASASFRGKPPLSATASAPAAHFEKALARAASHDGFLPSEALSPTDAAAARSAAAAVLQDQLLRAARAQLGAGLSLMAQSVELLPLALLVPLATSRATSAKALARLAAAIGAVHAAAEAAGYGHLVAKLLSPGASPAGAGADSHADLSIAAAGAGGILEPASSARAADATIISTASTLQPSVASRTGAAAADVAAAAQVLTFAGVNGTPVAARTAALGLGLRVAAPAAAGDGHHDGSGGVNWSRPLDDGLGEHRDGGVADASQADAGRPASDSDVGVPAMGPASPPGHPYMRFAAPAAARTDGSALDDNDGAGF